MGSQSCCKEHVQQLWVWGERGRGCSPGSQIRGPENSRGGDNYAQFTVEMFLLEVVSYYVLGGGVQGLGRGVRKKGISGEPLYVTSPPGPPPSPGPPPPKALINELTNHVPRTSSYE